MEKHCWPPPCEELSSRPPPTTSSPGAFCLFGHPLPVYLFAPHHEPPKVRFTWGVTWGAIRATSVPLLTSVPCVPPHTCA